MSVVWVTKFATIYAWLLAKKIVSNWYTNDWIIRDLFLKNLVNCWISTCYNDLFADAEMLEDILEDGVGGDFAYDVGEVVDGFAEVLGDEVAGEL